MQDSALPRILVDVSFWAQVEQRTGIQRVVKNIATEFHKQQSIIRSVPVQLIDNRLFPCNIVPAATALPPKPQPEVRPEANDIVLMLDSSWHLMDAFGEVFIQVRSQEGRIYTVVYDLIPILYSRIYPFAVVVIFTMWLHAAIENSDGLICISKAVADDLVAYIQRRKKPHGNHLKIGYFHLGADFKVAPAETAVRPQVEAWFKAGEPSFVTIGSIEPRKGQDIALDAFETLWDAGACARLIFAGQEGMKDQACVRRILSHPEHGKRLLWLNNPTDAEIIYCYQHADALLFPTITEGFGLPLIEAAEYGLPIICSDLPVLREIAAEFATYFPAGSSQQLAQALRDWLNQPEHPDSARMPRLTWQQSAGQLLDIILNDKWYTVLPPTV